MTELRRPGGRQVEPGQPGTAWEQTRGRRDRQRGQKGPGRDREQICGEERGFSAPGEGLKVTTVSIEGSPQSADYVNSSTGIILNGKKTISASRKKERLTQ